METPILNEISNCAYVDFKYSPNQFSILTLSAMGDYCDYHMGKDKLVAMANELLVIANQMQDD